MKKVNILFIFVILISTSCSFSLQDEKINIQQVNGKLKNITKGSLEIDKMINNKSEYIKNTELVKNIFRKCKINEYTVNELQCIRKIRNSDETLKLPNEIQNMVSNYNDFYIKLYECKEDSNCKKSIFINTDFYLLTFTEQRSQVRYKCEGMIQNKYQYFKCLKENWAKYYPKKENWTKYYPNDECDYALNEIEKTECKYADYYQFQYTQDSDEPFNSRMFRCSQKTAIPNQCLYEILSSEYFYNKAPNAQNEIFHLACKNPRDFTCQFYFWKFAQPNDSCSYFKENEIAYRNCKSYVNAINSLDYQQCEKIQEDSNYDDILSFYKNCYLSTVKEKTIQMQNPSICTRLRNQKFLDRISQIWQSVESPENACYDFYNYTHNRILTEISENNPEICNENNQFHVFKPRNIRNIIIDHSRKLCNCLDSGKVICQTAVELSKNSANYNNKNIFSFNADTKIIFDKCDKPDRFFEETWFEDFTYELSQINTIYNLIFETGHLSNLCLDKNNNFVFSLLNDFEWGYKIILFNTKTKEISYMDISEYGKEAPKGIVKVNDNIIYLIGDQSGYENIVGTDIFKTKYQYNILNNELIKIQ